MTTPSVSVLSLNFRNGKQAVTCARSLLNQTMADDMEILVVDNHSDDDSIGILRTALQNEPKIRIIETEKNAGFGAGYNRGAHYARGEYLLFNNPDKIPAPDTVERMVSLMRSDDSIGILAPKILHDDGTRRFSVRSFPTPLDCVLKRTFLGHVFAKRMERYLQTDLDPDVRRNADWVIGGCFMIKKSLFEELKGFDDRFFLFFEDIDLCRRCILRGKTVTYLPSVTVRDKKRRLSDGSAFRMLSTKVGRAHILSAFKYFLKWGFATHVNPAQR